MVSKWMKIVIFHLDLVEFRWWLAERWRNVVLHLRYSDNYRFLKRMNFLTLSKEGGCNISVNHSRLEFGQGSRWLRLHQINQEILRRFLCKVAIFRLYLMPCKSATYAYTRVRSNRKEYYIQIAAVSSY